MKPSRTYLIFCMFVFTFLKALAGSEAFLFVPNQYAPLSSFKQKTTTQTETLQFQVKPEIVQYVVNKGLSGWVAHSDLNGTIEFLSPTSYSLTTGLITLSTNRAGKFVVVADGFTNDFPVVTHWNKTLNSGRGGYQLGATDGIGVIDFSPVHNQFTESSDLFNYDANNPYTFNSEKYALFSSDPIAPDARVPGFERYVGENYSVFRVTDLAAVALSLRSIESSGFPVLHRNFPWGFWAEGPIAKKITESIPAFQIVHSLVLAPEPDKPSLSTYILPPRWIKNPTQPYPIAFNGFYDINQNFFEANGSLFLNTIGKLVNDGENGVVGILWNGGGSYGSHTFHLNSYFHAAYTMYVAQYFMSADLQNVVTIGISRGGSTALQMAANPFYDIYRTRYAISYCPPTFVGEIATQWLSTNYPGLYGNLGWGTGYKYAYRSDFIDSNTGLNGSSLFLKNSIGYTDPGIGDWLSISAEHYLQALKSKGTSVYLASGMNDNFIPFNQSLRFYDRLVEHGIPTQFAIGHRAGHTHFTDQNQILYFALKEVLRKTYTPFNGVKHYRRAAEDVSQNNTHIEFTPQSFVNAALPKLVWRGQKLKIEITGSRNLSYGVAYQKIDDSLWNGSGQIALVGQATYLTFNTFIGNQGVQSHAVDIEFPLNLQSGTYIYFVITSTDYGSNWTMTDLTHVPQPVANRLPLFQVQDSEINLQSSEISTSLNPLYTDRGWGLGTY